MQTVIHEIPPFYRANSKILILGTMPSPKSREQGFYYMHPQNRFWRVLAEVFREPFPESIESRKAILVRNRIALWDVLRCCEIIGASDASIRNAQPNDIARLMRQAPIEYIFATGKTAEKYYNRFLRNTLCREITTLPSPSPANCRISYDELYRQYRILSEVSS